MPDPRPEQNDPTRGSHILRQEDYQAMQAREWSEWRGRITQMLEHLCEKLDEHVTEDRGTFQEIREKRHEQNNRTVASLGEVWDGVNAMDRRLSFRVSKLDGRMKWYGGGGSLLLVVLNLVIAGFAAYAAWK